MVRQKKSGLSPSAPEGLADPSKRPIIGRINPGTSRTVPDMTLALVIEDVFRDVVFVSGSDPGRRDGRGELEVDIDGGEASFIIHVTDAGQHWEELELTTRRAFGLYSEVYDLSRELGLDEATRRLRARPEGLSEGEAAPLDVAKRNGLRLESSIRALTVGLYWASLSPEDERLARELLGACREEDLEPEAAVRRLRESGR